jgi:hypothetical protein
VTVAAGLATVVLGAAAAATTPFTPGAEATVGAGFLVVLVTLPLRRLTAGGAGTVPGTPGGARAAVVTTPIGPRRALRWTVLVAPLAVAVAWELVCVVHGDRTAWPTLSSLLDDVDAWPLARGTTYAAWLGLGWALVTR